MKFIIGYFSVIGLILIGRIIFPWGGEFLALFFLYYLWHIWGNKRLIATIGLSAFLSYYIFGIIIAYTFPIWIAIGIVSFLYGYAIGLFRKPLPDNVSKEPENKELNLKIPDISTKRKVLSTLGLIGAVIIIIWLTNYGFNTYPCEYTYRNDKIPSILVDKKIILKKSAYLVQGTPPDFCKWSEFQIVNQIVHPETINNRTIGKKHYEKQKRTVSKLEEGKEFDLIGVIAQTGHGIAYIGYIFNSSPTYFLHLKDEMGTEYRIFISSLGYDKDEAILSYYLESTELGALSWNFFRPYFQE